MRMVWLMSVGSIKYKSLLQKSPIKRVALQLVALLRKITCNLRHPLGLRHSVVFVCCCMSSICTWLFDKNRSVPHKLTVELTFVKSDFGQILVKTNSHASRTRAGCV